LHNSSGLCMTLKPKATNAISQAYISTLIPANLALSHLLPNNSDIRSEPPMLAVTPCLPQAPKEFSPGIGRCAFSPNYYTPNSEKVSSGLSPNCGCASFPFPE
ncbi:14472_t:CDS:2, partial [Racocetra fulgida]